MLGRPPFEDVSSDARGHYDNQRLETASRVWWCVILYSFLPVAHFYEPPGKIVRKDKTAYMKKFSVRKHGTLLNP